MSALTNVRNWRVVSISWNVRNQRNIVYMRVKKFPEAIAHLHDLIESGEINPFTGQVLQIEFNHEDDDPYLTMTLACQDILKFRETFRIPLDKDMLEHLQGDEVDIVLVEAPKDRWGEYIIENDVYKGMNMFPSQPLQLRNDETFKRFFRKLVKVCDEQQTW